MYMATKAARKSASTTAQFYGDDSGSEDEGHSQEDIERVRAGLREIGASEADFKDKDIEVLLDGGYRSAASLLTAMEKSLRGLDLPPGLVDNIVACVTKAASEQLSKRPRTEAPQAATD